MLKKRIIAVVLIKDGIAVQSIDFNRYLPIGKAEIAVDFLNQWGADEIILLDIDATKESRTISTKLITEVSKKCFTPLSVGGGLKTIEDLRAVFEAGADKVVLNHHLLKEPQFILDTAQHFGKQSLIASIDLYSDENQLYIYDYLHKSTSNKELFSYLQELQDLGIGEIIVQSVKHDGMQCGYEEHIFSSIERALPHLSVPIIALGGVANAQHIAQIVPYNQVWGYAAANSWHFKEQSIAKAKAYLQKQFPQLLRYDKGHL